MDLHGTVGVVAGEGWGTEAGNLLSAKITQEEGGWGTTPRSDPPPLGPTGRKVGGGSDPTLTLLQFRFLLPKFRIGTGKDGGGMGKGGLDGFEVLQRIGV